MCNLSKIRFGLSHIPYPNILTLCNGHGTPCPYMPKSQIRRQANPPSGLIPIPNSQFKIPHIPYPSICHLEEIFAHADTALANNCIDPSILKLYGSYRWHSQIIVILITPDSFVPLMRDSSSGATIGSSHYVGLLDFFQYSINR